MNYAIFQEILVLLAVAVVAVAAFRRMHLPPILGYLFVGVLVGPFGLEWIPDTQDTRFLAEFGVVFLLFTIGLEFSLSKLVAMRGVVLGLGGAQVFITTAIVAVVGWMLGISWASGIVAGGILAMSSTAIVIKQLTEQLELNSRHGRNAVGVLLFQDLAVIPFLILIPLLAGNGGDSLVGPLLLALVKGAAAFFVMLAFGHWLLRPIFYMIAAARSSELFVLAVLLFSLAAAWATHLAGLSLALGGFLAGVMMGETEFRHQVEADIRPFRDVLLGLFFITVGMLLDLQSLGAIWPWVALLVVLIVAGKAALITGVGKLGGMETGVSLRTGLVLAQGGEFGFALLALAISAGLIEHQTGQIVLAATLISMALSPLIVRANGAIAKRVCADTYLGERQQMETSIADASQDLRDHIVICGYGRIGQNIARFVQQEGFNYIALDLDPNRVREARLAGDNVFYGDSTHREILTAAGVERARVLVLSYDDAPSSMKVLTRARELRPDIPILVRARDDSHLDELQRRGATEVVPETLEASLMLASHLLYLLNVPVSTIVRRVRDVRADRYRLLRNIFPGDEATTPLEEAEGTREHLHSVTLLKGARAIGRALGDIKLDSCGVSVTAVRHADSRAATQDPPASLMLSEGDVLVLRGTPEHLEHAEAALLGG